MKPAVIITCGDPLGIGPEIVVKALKSNRIRKLCAPVLIGEEKTLLKTGWTNSLAPLLPIRLPGLNLRIRKPDKIAGLISYKAAHLAVRLALSGKIPVVTAPISKQSWRLAGIPFTGHTELLKTFAEKEPLMMFVARSLKAALVTEHLAVKALSGKITKRLIVAKCRIFASALKKVDCINNPNIGICGLNPHSGDRGLMGNEEIKTLIPAINFLRKRYGINAKGPLPPDQAWLEHMTGKHDGILCMYHDQAVNPIKIAAGAHRVVHYTAGLPFTRTSPAHGTAFDIAGKNAANPSSMIEAIIFACALSKSDMAFTPDPSDPEKFIKKI